MIKKYFSLTALFVCSVFLLSACTTGPAKEMVREQEQEAEQESFSGSIKDLLGKSKNVECRWSYEDEQSKVSGVAYVSGEKARTEMRISTEQGEMQSYFLSDGQMAYTWGDQVPGYKFNLADFEDNETEQEDAGRGQSYKGWNDNYEYKCQNWKVDQSKFAVPTNINFTDMGEQMKQVQEQTEGLKENMKGLCDSLPEAQKAECLKGLSE